MTNNCMQGFDLIGGKRNYRKNSNKFGGYSFAGFDCSNLIGI